MPLLKHRVCRLMPQREFVSFCRDRNVKVSDERLRRLEHLRLFHPILRIYRIDTVHKVELLDEGRQYRDFGALRENEVWSGDTRNELAGFDFRKRVIRSWREHGNVWEPRADVSPHTETIDTDARRHEAYFSQFQVFELDRLTQSLTVAVDIEWALEADGTIDASWGDELKPNLSSHAERMAKLRVWDAEASIGIICQIVSDRYYPKTQSDERHITVSDGGLYFRDWDWYEYARAWDAPAIAKRLTLDGDTLRAYCERIERAYKNADPLEQWQGLVRFVSVKKREKLKGDALKAQALGEMAKMLRLFHRDAFGEEPGSTGGQDSRAIHRIPDVNAEDDPLRSLELVANDFGMRQRRSW
jgi:hypothetical protein